MSTFNNKEESALRHLKEQPPAPGNAEMPMSGEAKASSGEIDVYKHGFTNGLYKIPADRDKFENFIDASNEVKRVEDEIKSSQLRLQKLESEYILEVAEKDKNEEVHFNAQYSIEKLNVQIEESKENLACQKKREADLVNQKLNLLPEYAWLPALIFMIAGFVFIAGDITITQQITSWGYDMKETEGWIFATGLAFTAFLIKPLIDRMLEKVYHKSGGQLKRAYRIVLVSITVVGLVMIVILGQFRSDAQIAKARLDEIDARTEKMKDINSPEYKNAEKQRDQISQSLYTAEPGILGIILSGVVFAIGGAICLSIAFPSLTNLINRYWILPTRIARLRIKIRHIQRHLDELRARMAESEIAKQKAEQKINNNSLAKLEAEVQKVEILLSELTRLYYTTKSRRDRSLYLDAKNRGEQYRIDGELLYRVVDDSDKLLAFSTRNGGSTQQESKSSRTYTRRPFVKIRKMIADNYNRNQINNVNDGTEFEIVS